jgi:hypothetical protein
MYPVYRNYKQSLQGAFDCGRFFLSVGMTCVGLSRCFSFLSFFKLLTLQRPAGPLFFGRKTGREKGRISLLSPQKISRPGVDISLRLVREQAERIDRAKRNAAESEKLQRKKEAIKNKQQD